MKNQRFEELFQKFLQGLTTGPENQELQEARKADFDEMSQEAWEHASPRPLSEADRTRLHLDILERIRKHGLEQKDHRLRLRRALLKIAIGTAAAAILAGVSVWTGYRYSENEAARQQYELTCANGQQSVLTLPDGTIVHLNSSSKLTYASSYNNQDRKVCLEGEAFFEVAHDAGRPFTVQADEMEIKVLGTRFNVKAYDDDEEIVATLVEGKIQAHVNGTDAILLPNERLLYQKASGRLIKTSHIEENSLVPWLEKQIYFEHNSLAEIAVILERMYDVEVRFEDPRLQNLSYTGLVRNISLKNILELIAGTSCANYRIEDNTVTFY